MAMNQRIFRVLEFEKILKNLAQLTLSIPAEEKCKELKPFTDIHEVNHALDETSEGLSILLSGVNLNLSGLHDIREILAKVKIGGILEPGELLKIGSILIAGKNIRKFLKSKEKRRTYPIIEGFIEQITDIPALEDKIFKAILSDEEIADNASSELLRLRKEMKNIHNKIKDKMQEIIQSPTFQKILQDPIVTIRNGRYVVPVKREHSQSFPGMVHDQSASGATHFIEPLAVVNLNNLLKEVQIKEQREIIKILSKLTEAVAIYSEELNLNSNILYHLDFIMAKAKLSMELEGTRPEINNVGRINIKNGRHPLIPKDKVVATDIRVGGDFRTLVITGPNTGGKTVTLKTVGLLTLMAQSGLHIPAAYGSEISCFDEVFADIGDEQSIEQSLSTFSSHMSNIVSILPNVGKKTLILLDELGAGTDPTEGAALAMAILDYLYEREGVTIATTHYSEIKIYALKKPGVENASVEFDLETLSPTYRLLIGIPGKSNAFEISTRLGLDREIISKAKSFLDSKDIRFEDVLRTIHEDKRKIEEEKDETLRLKSQIQEIKERHKEEMEKLERNRARIIEKAKEEAATLLENVRIEAEEIIKELRKMLQTLDTQIVTNKEIEGTRLRLKNIKEKLLFDESVREIPTEADKTLKPGDNVVLLEMNQRGTLIEIQKNEGVVQVGILKLNVPLNKLKKEKTTVSKELSAQSQRIKINKSATISPRIDIRGLSLDEALEQLDKYLDDAYLAGLINVEIIHGKGTGTLRKGIQEHLKGHHHIRTFRIGQYGEGGEGITIAELKN